MNAITKNKLVRFFHNSKLNLGLATGIALVVVLAGYFLGQTIASGFFASLEGEQGTTSGNAQIITDANASGGKAVQFNAPAAPSGGGGGTATTTCPLPKYPDASCTGVPTNIVLAKYDGPADITAPNTVIDSKYVSSCLTIDAPGVVITRSLINAAGCAPDVILNNASSKYHSGYAGTGLRIEDSEIGCYNLDGQGRPDTTKPTNGTAIGDVNVTVLRSNIHGCENGFDMDLNADIEDNYIHDLFQSAEAHTDGLQSYDGSNLTIKHNTFYGDTPLCSNPSYCAGTSAVNVNANTAPGIHTANLTIKDNLLAGGAYTLYCPALSTTNSIVQNNHFSFKFRDPKSTVAYGPGVPAPWKPDAGPGVGDYGPWTNCDDGAAVSDNVFHETNAALGAF